MARRWVVLTAARGTLPIHSIVQYTEWADRPAASDEVIYTDPVDASDNPVDGNWKVGGTLTLAGSVYTFTDPPGQITPDDATTNVGRKRAAARGALDQIDRWRRNLREAGRRGQSSTVRALGDDLLLGQTKALYLRAVDATITVAAFESYCQQIARGASDVTDVPTYFRIATPLRKGVWRDGDPVEWATLTNNVATRRTLQASITAAPADFVAGVRDFSNIDLGTDDWITTAITS